MFSTKSARLLHVISDQFAIKKYCEFMPSNCSWSTFDELW